MKVFFDTNVYMADFYRHLQDEGLLQ